jgi:hypothetical protein
LGIERSGEAPCIVRTSQTGMRAAWHQGMEFLVPILVVGVFVADAFLRGRAR